MVLSQVNKYNTFGKRFWAGMIDALVFIPIEILDSVLGDPNDPTQYMIYQTSYIVLYTLYVVIGHGQYGQTLGKKAMGLKVLDISETKLIGYGRAFLRESIWFFFSASVIIYMLISMNREMGITPQEIMNSEFNFYFPLAWFVIEIFTTLTNKKYRALHDYIAGSVVIRLDAKETAVS